MGSNQCCCFNIKNCATIVAIIGIVFSILTIIASILSLFSSIFYWYYIPLASFSLIIYILVLIGVCKENPTFLLPALIFFGIDIFCKILYFIGFLLVGIILPQRIEKLFNTDFDRKVFAEKFDENTDKAINVIHLAFFISAGIVIFLTIYTIFAFIVIFRTRKYFKSLIEEDTLKDKNDIIIVA